MKSMLGSDPERRFNPLCCLAGSAWKPVQLNAACVYITAQRPYYRAFAALLPGFWFTGFETAHKNTLIYSFCTFFGWEVY